MQAKDWKWRRVQRRQRGILWRPSQSQSGPGEQLTPTALPQLALEGLTAPWLRAHQGWKLSQRWFCCAAACCYQHYCCSCCRQVIPVPLWCVVRYIITKKIVSRGLKYGHPPTNEKHTHFWIRKYKREIWEIRDHWKSLVKIGVGYLCHCLLMIVFFSAALFPAAAVGASDPGARDRWGRPRSA